MAVHGSAKLWRPSFQWPRNVKKWRCGGIYIYIIYSKIYYLLYYTINIYIYIHLNKIDLHKVQFGDDDLPFTCQALACFFLTESPA